MNLRSKFKYMNNLVEQFKFELLVLFGVYSTIFQSELLDLQYFGRRFHSCVVRFLFLGNLRLLIS